MKFVKIASLILSVGLFACQKEDLVPENSKLSLLNQEVMKPSLHNTSTSFNIPVSEDEVMFSFILNTGSSVKDAVVFYSVDNYEYDKSLYLTKGLNTADHGFDQGLFTNGVKAVMKKFDISNGISRKYNFKIVRLSEMEKYTYFGIEILPCGNVILCDDVLKSNQAKPVITYYIKSTSTGIVEYVNVRIE